MKWDEMTARERDALVATEVMGEPKPTSNVPPGVLSGFATSGSGGGNWIGTTSGYTSGDEPVWMPKPFTTDIACAWEVVEKIKERASVEIYGGPDDEGGCDHWTVQIVHHGYRQFQDEVFTAEAGTLPMAFCLAALRAKGVEV